MLRLHQWLGEAIRHKIFSGDPGKYDLSFLDLFLNLVVMHINVLRVPVGFLRERHCLGRFAVCA